MTKLICRFFNGQRIQTRKKIARVNEPQNEKVFTENNLIDVIVTESIAAGYLEKLVLKPKIADLFVVDHGKADLLELYVLNNNLIGKTVGELSPTDDYFICGIHDEDNENISIATSDMVLKENCRISLLVKSESISKVLISSPNNGGIAFVRDNNGRRQSRSESCICIN